MDSPHVKAHLLLQSHFNRNELPCTDYHTDTKSVLDQAIRILQVHFGLTPDAISERNDLSVFLGHDRRGCRLRLADNHASYPEPAPDDHPGMFILVPAKKVENQMSISVLNRAAGKLTTP